jgi:hypothetical protein
LWRSGNRKFISKNNLLRGDGKTGFSTCAKKPTLRGLASTAVNAEGIQQGGH